MKAFPRPILGLLLFLSLLVVASWQWEADRGLPGAGGACCPLLPRAEPPATPPVGSQFSESSAPQPVIAYYFHGTVRCETCLIIEQQAQTVIAEQFGPEVAAGLMVFVPVNYELPGNEHFVSDYQLPCPSLVLAREGSDSPEKWRLLGETWQRVGDPTQLQAYVAAEVRDFLGNAAPSGSIRTGQPRP